MVVKPRCSGTMTEAQYLAWIRSALRSKSLRWPPRAEALKLARRAYKGPNKLQKWQYECAMCGKWFMGKEVVVDHYPVAAGSILRWEDIGAFANNLYCETSNLRVLDKQCHDAHTHAEKTGMTIEDAKAAKQAIEFCKKDSKIVIKFLAEAGYNGALVSNATKRRTLVEALFKEKING